MMEDRKENDHVVNHFEAGSNCQVFNGPVTGCVFAMPGSTVTQQTTAQTDGDKAETPPGSEGAAAVPKPMFRHDEELFHFVHPELDDEEAWHIHTAVKRMVKLQGIQMICQYLTQLKNEKKVLLPPNPSAAYAELVRMGMPNGEGFNEITFRKYYNKR